MGQAYEDDRHPVAFISRTLNTHVQNYAGHDLELVSIVDTLRTWRCYLHGQKFIAHTDYHSLKFLEIQEFLTPQLVRWLELLAIIDFEVVKIKDKSNQVADGLSWQSSKTIRSYEYSLYVLQKVMKKNILWCIINSHTRIKLQKILDSIVQIRSFFKGNLSGSSGTI